MYEDIIVLLIVLIAFVIMAMRISRSLKGKRPACGCGSEKACAGCRDVMPDNQCPGSKPICKSGGY